MGRMFRAGTRQGTPGARSRTPGSSSRSNRSSSDLRAAAPPARPRPRAAADRTDGSARRAAGRGGPRPDPGRASRAPRPPRRAVPGRGGARPPRRPGRRGPPPPGGPPARARRRGAGPARLRIEQLGLERRDGLGADAGELGRPGVRGVQQRRDARRASSLDRAGPTERAHAGVQRQASSRTGANRDIGWRRSVPSGRDMAGRVMFIVQRGGYEPAYQAASMGITAAALGERWCSSSPSRPSGSSAAATSGAPSPTARWPRGRGPRGWACRLRRSSCPRRAASGPGASPATPCSSSPASRSPEAERVLDEVLGLAALWRLTEGARLLTF